MGAWGSEVYGNDDALELVDEVIGGGGVERLRAAFAHVLKTGDDYLEAPEAAQAVAAADIVSRLRGRNVPADTGVPELQEWLEGVDFFAAPAVVEEAGRALERVVKAPSELVELWTERGELDAAWANQVWRIAGRLV